MGNKLKFTVPSEIDSIKALTFLKQKCGLSSRMITRLKREKDGILMNGKILRTVDYLTGGDTVEINLPDEKSSILPVCGSLDTAYEDEHLIIVNKPPSMPVHPVKQHQSDTLANILTYNSMQKGESYVFRAVNRLDKDTSGLVIIAKDKFTANFLKNKVDKTYFALCHGRLEGEGTVDGRIGLQDGSKIVRAVRADGMPSVTHYKSIVCTEDISYVALKLETGRTHQIRCHMSSIRHPLLGDDLYGGGLDIIKRQALHCGELSFLHPATGKIIEVKAELPDDMQVILDKIKGLK